VRSAFAVSVDPLAVSGAGGHGQMHWTGVNQRTVKNWSPAPAVIDRDHISSSEILADFERDPEIARAIS